VWLYNFMVLDNVLCCEFAFILAYFEPRMAHNLVWFIPSPFWLNFFINLKYVAKFAKGTFVLIFTLN